MEDNEKQVSVEDLQKALEEKDAMLQDMQSQFQAVKSKADQLLDETKKAKAQAREREEARLAEEEKAKKAGDFEQLFKSAEQRKKELEEELFNLKSTVTSEKTRAEAMKIASELADGPNAELLSDFISRRIKYTEDGLKVLNDKGDLTVSSIEELKNEFANSEKYKSLIRGSRSSGGGAAGDGGSASGVSTIQRAQFDKMNATQRMDFIKKGGKVTD